MGAIVPCIDCDARPVTTCARCEVALCGRHRPRRGRRCHRCEREYADGAAGRNRLKFVLAVPVAALATALTFGLLLPVTGPGLIGSIVVACGAASAATGAGGAIVVGLERSARAQFLREHGSGLPAARVVRRLLPP
jgi:hypothetical protein